MSLVVPQYGVKAVALHATYQFGDSPEYSFGKRERLRRAGLWLVDDENYYKPNKLLVVSGDLLKVADVWVVPCVCEQASCCMWLRMTERVVVDCSGICAASK